MAKRIFISKQPGEIQALQTELESQGYLIHAHSFLQFAKVEFDFETPFDVIFFGSQRAVMFYHASASIPSNVAIACVGNKTAEILQRMGYNVDFIGKQAGKVSEVAQDFKTWCGDRKVLFPISDISLKTIASVFSEEQKEEIVVYSTSVVSTLVPEADTYVFTSPSNVQGFIGENAVPSNATVIAWGESTAKALHASDISVSHTLSSSDRSELIRFL